MFSASTGRATLRAARAIHPFPSSFRPSVRNIATSTRQHTGRNGWRLAGAVGAAAAGYAAWELKPELLPTPQPLHADAPPSRDTYIDPTTSTPFPSHVVSPDGTKLRLVGTGVRTVSFLSIRVYTVAFYVSERELELAQQGKLAGWEGYTPERLIPPYSIPEGEPKRLVGEELVDSLLEKADAAVVIVPLRNTGLTHLRDAFTRAILARMKIPRVVEAFTEEAHEASGAALVEFKSFFPAAMNLKKGQPLTLYYSAVNRSVRFELQDDKTGAPQTLGTFTEPLLSKELMVSYFSNTTAPSSELVKSVAMGFNGEGRP
ncbi:hypothetical protein JCM10213_008858 [Rhodosporidiobolus nylandii]